MPSLCRSAFAVALAFGELLQTPVFAAATDYEEIEWAKLVPKEDLVILQNPPQSLFGITEGSEADKMETLDKIAGGDLEAKRFKEALLSTNVVPELDGKKVRIPGFIVPLHANENREVVTFFIVPYFGACLHLPPPPPNQILYAHWEEGVAVEALSIPMWFEGTLVVQVQENETGKSAYSFQVDNVEHYKGIVQ